MMNTMYGDIKTAVKNSLAGKHRVAIGMFRKLLAASAAHDPVLRAEAGFAFDRSGNEAEAIPLYQSALQGDLPDPMRVGVYFCLASSYRNVGKNALARAAVREALSLFPGEPLFLVMSAILDFDGGRPQKSVACLLQVIARHVQGHSLDPYRWFFERESRKIRRGHGEARSV
ncbi:hypothetical protein D8B23_20565 [Verminephrobacter aporrectodeae subsp. tuberculatae]|nr:tetratricopeptide repeat protein [Verminephrobacter aporrectodeae]MCW5257672.1 hypothetical protein [Verminephrobacter aporrectodeae subsp. tuberculatae]MCW8164193.1 hypothetical protein [Verminephrobacter aporrectodeae subsp. tuberculatae]MCW8169240.1 hypothetical protein [Verminephrobacter aporrectodeae subsp. tuberculatae]MCW8176382.1 hypothetical protein [Verminephrobacter aporrectodeae subsp. tuberculatae]MCW8200722.1 hypothetical protein [Verminephrobacter aporrectodeae subsp. tubercu